MQWATGLKVVPIVGIQGNVNCIKIDWYCNVYIGTDQDFYCLEQNETNAKPITNINGKVNAIDFVYSLNDDDDYDNFWIFIGTDYGLYRLNTEETDATLINNINGKINIAVINIQGNIYIGTDYGLYRLNEDKTNATLINNINGKGNTTDFVYSHIDDNDDFCICIDTDYGLYRLNADEIDATLITNW